MNPRQLEAFQAVIRTGSITAAAEVLHISQPSVSRLIADLERAVGFALFQKSGRSVSPTVEGRRFYQSVDAMFVGVERLADVAATIRSAAGGAVSLGAIQSLSTTELPGAVGEMHRRNPDVRITIHVRNTPSIVDAVQMQQFDLGIVGRRPPYGGVHVLYATSVPYVCVMPKDHLLAKGYGAIDLVAEAGSERFVSFAGSIRDEMSDLEGPLAELLARNSPVAAANMPVAAALVKETGAFAITDPFSASRAVHIGGVVFRPITHGLAYHIAVITRSPDTLSLAGKAFANCLIERLTTAGRAIQG